jgi:hypothetical protein
LFHRFLRSLGRPDRRNHRAHTTSLLVMSEDDGGYAETNHGCDRLTVEKRQRLQAVFGSGFGCALLGS